MREVNYIKGSQRSR